MPQLGCRIKAVYDTNVTAGTVQGVFFTLKCTANDGGVTERLNEYDRPHADATVV